MPAKDELHDNPAYQLWLATHAWQRSLRKALQPLGLTHVQYVVLASVDYLRSQGVDVGQTDICRFGSLDANMVSSVVRALASQGLVTRTVAKEDRRAFRVALTTSGEALLEKARVVARPVSVGFFEPIGDDRIALARMLAKLVGVSSQAETAEDA